MKYTRVLTKKISTSLRFVAIAAMVSSTILVPMILFPDHVVAASSTLQDLKVRVLDSRPFPTSSGALITAGPSRKPCIYVGGNLQPDLANAEAQTGTSPSCIMEFLNGALNWTQWEEPWVTAPYHGFTRWVAAEPHRRQLILQVDLIPDSLEDQSNPSGWEQSCAEGQFNAYARKLGTSLVAAGLENSVIRLGAEMNGPWEADFMGTTMVEQNLWASCFAHEVSGLREATGEHFLIDWNPNARYENVPYTNYYPGNAYVNIVGLDLYDVARSTLSQPLTWSQFVNEPAGLETFEAFAAAHKKPMSFPEWGLVKGPTSDDAAYVNGMGSTFASKNFAFATYFDAGDRGTLKIGRATPYSLVAFQKWFG
jgi:hypothetical protein